MATREGSAANSLPRSKVIVRRNHYGAPVTIIPPDRSLIADVGYVWLRYMWGPWAVAASLWSHTLTLLKDGCGRTRRSGLPWLTPPRVPGLTWVKRPGGGGSSGSRGGGSGGDGGPESQGRRWMS